MTQETAVKQVEKPWDLAMGDEFYSIDIVLEIDENMLGDGFIYIQTQLNSYKRNKKSLNVVN